MNDLDKYEKVNNCETIDELQQCIKDFANNGIIQGKTRMFDAEKMFNGLLNYYYDSSETIPPNIVTRMWGLRQQAIYLKYYK